jgi:DNA uptake protein ComE-like DNA-binding protein
MKKYIALMFSLLMALSSVTVNLSANYVQLTGVARGVVTAVFDGNAIEVRLDNGNMALVRLLGVETHGSDEAYKWLTNEILGSTVRLERDPAITDTNRWNRMYVFRDSDFINLKILQNGLGRIVSADLPVLSRRQEFVSAENFARSAGAGIWYSTPPSLLPAVINYDRVNINTVTTTYLMDNFENMEWMMAQRIVSYRLSNPYKTIYDIKFVPGMTKALFDEIRPQITVTTDINTASRFEIMSLDLMTDEWADELIKAREEKPIEDLLTAFLRIPGFTWVQTFWRIRDVITVEGFPATVLSQPNITVNINTASRERLIQAGLNASRADIVITQRNMYHIKSLYELANVSGLGFTEGMVNSLADNLTTRTDINNATEQEIRSLLNIAVTHPDITAIMRNRPFTDMEHLRNNITAASFERIEPHIFIGSGSRFTEYVNVNTATISQLTGIGYSTAQASAIHARRGRMLTPRDLPADAAVHARQITMITNINIASPSELSTLGAFMTDAFISEIIAYRNDQPFGSRAEIQSFFIQNQMLAHYRTIERFIHVR